MTFIDDATRFCMLLRTKDESLDKAEVENQLERKINVLGRIMVESIFLKSLKKSMRITVLFMRVLLPTRSNQMEWLRGKNRHCLTW
jgi:hypothetical protein